MHSPITFKSPLVRFIVMSMTGVNPYYVIIHGCDFRHLLPPVNTHTRWGGGSGWKPSVNGWCWLPLDKEAKYLLPTAQMKTPYKGPCVTKSPDILITLPSLGLLSATQPLFTLPHMRFLSERRDKRVRGVGDRWAAIHCELKLCLKAITHGEGQKLTQMLSHSAGHEGLTRL